MRQCSKMQDIPFVVYNANRSGAKLSRFTHKSLHHRPVCKQEVIHRIWIQLCEMVVDFVGVFYFCNVFWRGKHTFPDRTAVTCSKESVFCSIAREE